MRRSVNKFIVLEGLSGTGKTTIAKILARKIDAKLIQTPLEPFRGHRKYLDTMHSFETRYFFYLASIMQASQAIRSSLKQSHVICDRYIFTTHCFHKSVGVKNTINIDKLPIVKPNYTFLITCDEETRKKRLLKRGLTINDSWEQLNKIDNKFLKEYKKFKLINIDNGSDDLELAVNDIIKRIL